MKKQLFEYVILLHPAKDDKTTSTTILVDKTSLLARDDKEVGMLAARAIPAENLDRIEDIQIIIRPF